jgi:2-polyprenyl-3-methyl-5-hydroxy-6-metoxy-1,4-benzoquinol methylase
MRKIRNLFPPRAFLRNCIVIETIKNFKCRTLLEIGFGNGKLLNELFFLGYECTGYEASSSAIEAAKKASPTFRVVDNLQQLEQFDLICALEVVTFLRFPIF